MLVVRAAHSLLTLDNSLSQTITVDRLSSVRYDMSTANNAKKVSNDAPWKDWKPDPDFLSKANEYCKDHQHPTFIAMIGGIIEKAKEGVGLFGDLLASLSRLFPLTSAVFNHLSE